MTVESNAGPPVEQPALWLGMAGFSPKERAVLEDSLARSGAVPQWRAGAFTDADAWWVNGARVRPMPDGNLKVAPGLPTERTLSLDLGEVDRPVAFALPLAGDDFEPRCTFDPVSQPSIDALLAQFDHWLWLVRAQFVLGAQLVHHAAGLRRGVYHVAHAGKLLAVLDLLKGNCAIAPGAPSAHLWQAEWHKRPASALDLPESFTRCTPAQLVWTYVRRSGRDLLPDRYRTRTIHYRHVPGVPLRWLRDSQLLLLRELSAQPGTLDALRQRTGLPLATIEHDLSCLYHAYAITTTRSAAAPAPPPPGCQPHATGPGLDPIRGHDSEFPGPHADLTAPALLEPRRDREAPDGA